MFIGILAGVLSVVGFAVILPRLQGKIKKIDTCGVMYLHGLPGLLGGLAALFVVKGINSSAQLTGIGITVGIALITGYLSGLVLSFFGRRAVAYDDAEEFLDVE